MRWPPLLLKIHIENEHNSFPIWLPLFILGPIFLIFLFAIFLIALPFVLLGMIFSWEYEWWRSFFLFFPLLWQFLIHMSGLDIDVGGKNDNRVHIVFI